MKNLVYLFALIALVVPGFAGPFRVVVFGDSNTYGWIPTAESHQKLGAAIAAKVKELLK
jgi:hypothetical protein